MQAGRVHPAEEAVGVHDRRLLLSCHALLAGPPVPALDVHIGSLVHTTHGASQLRAC